MGTLSGTIPIDIANMTSLQRWVLPDNKLSGTIPNIFASMNMSLETWDTFNNKLTGDLPTSIAELANLEYLYVQNEHTDPLRNYYCKERISQNSNGKKYNQIAMQKDYISCEDPCYAPIDGDDCRFGRITSLHLPGNNLTGTIPWQIFDSLVNLTIVDLSHNDISGTIPTEVGKLRNINMFILGNNKLSGTIPTEIYTMGSHVGPDEQACALEDLVMPDGTPFVVPEGGVNFTADEAEAFNATCSAHATNTMGLSQFDVSANKLIGMLPTTFG